MERKCIVNRFVLFPIIIVLIYIGLFLVQNKYLYMYYVFGWVCNNGIIFFYLFAFLSCLVAIFGLKITPFVSIMGFILGELLGQFLGNIFIAGTNIGWFIFIVTYLLIYRVFC